jgi:HK97 family phage prohead protease
MKNLWKDKKFELIAKVEKTVAEDGELFIEGMASTNDIDRMGDVISSKAWEENGGLDNFKNNPIILFNHDADRPIGRATEIESTDNGLRIKARISKAAGEVYDLIKDGVLGAFSVSFLIHDADFIEETYGLLIKDAELLENSVVSIPCNQTATFSVAKSFESTKDYEDFKKAITSSVAGQSGGADEENSSNVSTDTPAGAQDAQMEINMTPEEIKALTEKVAKDAAEAATAAMKIQQDLKEAETKAAQEASDKAAAIAAEAAINITAKSNAEKLVEDMEADLLKKDADMAAVVLKFKTDLEEQAKELDDMRNGKGNFTDRTNNMNTGEFISKNGQELMYAHMLGVFTDKGWDTEYAKDLLQKGGIEYLTEAPRLDEEIQNRIQKEITNYTKVAQLFRDIPVNGASTVMPVQGDTNMAVWQSGATLDATYENFTGNLENNPQLNATGTAPTYEVQQVIMNVFRLISSSYIDNDTDEQILINIMPMMIEGVARAHARAVENMLLNDGGSILGLGTHATANTTAVAPTVALPLTAKHLLSCRTDMGKYGLNPDDVVYIVDQTGYFALIGDPAFENINEVGHLATKITGMVGAVYGTPVIVSGEFPAVVTGSLAALCVHTASYVMPRLRNMKVEQDYEVGRQRRIVVATQSLGFTELFEDAPACVSIVYGTIA